MCLRDVGTTLGESEELQAEDRLARMFTIFAMTGPTGDQLWEEVDHNMEEKVS